MFVVMYRFTDHSMWRCHVWPFYDEETARLVAKDLEASYFAVSVVKSDNPENEYSRNISKTVGRLR